MNTDPSKKQLREFSILFGFGFPFFFGLLIPLISNHEFRLWTFFIGILFLILGFIEPYLLFYPYKFWMKIGHVLGWVNSRLVLGLVFLIVLMPISFVMKLFGYDPLRKKKDNQNSYKEKKIYGKFDLTKIF